MAAPAVNNTTAHTHKKITKRTKQQRQCYKQIKTEVIKSVKQTKAITIE